jgi:hypothetical protein
MLDGGNGKPSRGGCPTEPCGPISVSAACKEPPTTCLVGPVSMHRWSMWRRGRLYQRVWLRNKLCSGLFCWRTRESSEVSPNILGSTSKSSVVIGRVMPPPSPRSRWKPVSSRVVTVKRVLFAIAQNSTSFSNPAEGLPLRVLDCTDRNHLDLPRLSTGSQNCSHKIRTRLEGSKVHELKLSPGPP